MSADLFAAFGQGNEAEASPSKVNQQVSTAASTEEDTDSFFDFSAPGESRPQYGNLQSKVTKIEPIFQPGNDGGNDVLFDASDRANGEDDDFGDFEDVEGQPTSASVSEKLSTTAATRSSTRPRHPSNGNNAVVRLDLLSLGETPTELPQPQNHNAASESSFNVFSPLSEIAQTSHAFRAATPPSADGRDDEGWGDFEAVPSTQPSLPPKYKANGPGPLQATTGMTSRSLLRALQPKSPESKPNESENWDPFEDGSLVSSSQPQAAVNQPTTYKHPSPALLLSLLPLTFESLVAVILSDLTTPNLSTQITTAFRVSGRVISPPARVLRWRRDTLLSQSTRIGAAGKSSGGMKLSSLNKGESVKEEREAAEAVEVWNSKNHHFTKALKASGTAMSLKLSANMPVKPLTRPGVIQAAIMCPVCGLKRSERVIGIDDVGVEDVFGEYWLENWGHKECAEWWYRWNGELGQR